jgi:hypothetical protein
MRHRTTKQTKRLRAAKRAWKQFCIKPSKNFITRHNVRIYMTTNHDTTPVIVLYKKTKAAAGQIATAFGACLRRLLYHVLGRSMNMKLKKREIANYPPQFKGGNTSCMCINIAIKA